MALDGAFLYKIRQELTPLIGGRIDKIYQPGKEEIIIQLRANGTSAKILLSASAGSARIHLTSASVDNPKAPPMFCMLMRKHLGGGRLVSIRQDGLERILYLDFEAINEMGDMVTITVSCEIMGRYSNIILINQNGKIIDSIKRVDEEMSRERLVLPGMSYTFPPRVKKTSLLDADKSEIKAAVLSVGDYELSKAVVKAFEGVSPLLAGEAAFFASKTEINVSQLDEDTTDKLVFYLMNIQKRLAEQGGDFCVLVDKNRSLKDFCFVPVHQYGGLVFSRDFQSAGETLDYFYRERDTINRMKQRSGDILKLLSNTSDRITRRIAVQKDDLLRCAKRDEYKLYGDLVNANIYRLEKGMTTAVLENYFSDNCAAVEIPLDKRLTPAQNAQKYYSEYRKCLTAEEKLVGLISAGEQELEYIDSVFDALTRSSSEQELEELKLELSEQGYIRRGRMKGKAPKPMPPVEFVSSDGYTVLMGRNNVQNDILTTKTAEKTDIWLHTHNIPGSHVIIRTNGDTPPDKTVEEAAVIAATNSKARDSAQVPVDYTQVKFVKKPAGAKPGKVIFTNNITAYVTPDPELCEKLRKQGKK